MPKRKTHDALGDRMKRYELSTRYALPRRTYTIIRVDGRAFHTFTKKLARPYDTDFMAAMDTAAIALCEQIAGAQLAFVQSDEISVLATDFTEIETQAWFDGVVQKWTSVSASIATAAFNYEVAKKHFAVVYDFEIPLPQTSPLSHKLPLATFDSRVFLIPDYIEVENYFVWRQQDAIRNSITMLAQSKASHKELHGKNRAAQHEIIHRSGDNWAKHPNGYKNGRIIRKSTVQDWGKNLGQQPSPENYKIGNWFIDENTPVFTKNRAWLRAFVPQPWANKNLEG